MKKVTLIRHAKSSWEDMTLRDHDRPLNKRGKRDAPFMAQMMASRGWRPDRIISSTANRAQTTAHHFAAALDFSPDQVLLQERIYEASIPTLVNLIAQLDDEWSEVALFGHNPTFTMVANLFYRNDYLDNLPTCGIVEIEAPTVSKWEAFTPDTAQVVAVHYPKQYF
ncbi:MAG: histidine phosphatase family protein [Bacteroidota bacterium]